MNRYDTVLGKITEVRETGILAQAFDEDRGRTVLCFAPFACPTSMVGSNILLTIVNPVPSRTFGTIFASVDSIPEENGNLSAVHAGEADGNRAA